MTRELIPGSMKRFHHSQWRCQTTFRTPLKDLRNFVPAFLTSLGPVESASLIIGAVVFPAKNLDFLTSVVESSFHTQRDIVICCDDALQITPLLVAALSDWIDFAFIPVPKSFAIYADHDEYTTFYSNKPAQMHDLTDRLVTHGYRLVKDWKRAF